MQTQGSKRGVLFCKAAPDVGRISRRLRNGGNPCGEQFSQHCETPADEEQPARSSWPPASFTRPSRVLLSHRTF